MDVAAFHTFLVVINRNKKKEPQQTYPVCEKTSFKSQAYRGALLSGLIQYFFAKSKIRAGSYIYIGISNTLPVATTFHLLRFEKILAYYF
jgi:hypothetical protein